MTAYPWVRLWFARQNFGIVVIIHSSLNDLYLYINMQACKFMILPSAGYTYIIHVHNYTTLKMMTYIRK